MRRSAGEKKVEAWIPLTMDTPKANKLRHEEVVTEARGKAPF